MSAAGGYEARIEQGIEQYRLATGRQIDPARLDRSDPAVRALYARFVARPLRFDLGAHEAEWWMLELGLKQVLRERVEEPRLAELSARCRREGWRLLIDRPGENEEAVAEEAAWRRRLRARLGDAPAPDGAATAALAPIHAYVGRDPAALEEARALDRSMLPFQVARRPALLGLAARRARAAALQGLGLAPLVSALGRGWERLAAPVRARFGLGSGATRARADRAERGRRLGELLGYPACCLAAFARFDRLHDNLAPIRTAAADSQRFSPLLNNLSLSLFHFPAWFPCRYDCEPSLIIARRLDEALAERRPRQRAAIQRLLAMPRIYLDERRQLFFDGEMTGGRVDYRAVFTPFAFDRQPRLAAYEWTFYIDVVAPLLEGDGLRVEDGVWRVFAGERLLSERPAPEGAVWLPFRAEAPR